jgi:hypothetical protein
MIIAKFDTNGNMAVDNGTTVDNSSLIPVSSAAVPAIADTQWTGAQLKPAVSVTLGGKALKAGTDYTVSYGANKDIGKGTVTITGKGSYTGTKTASFKIVPKKMSLKSAKAGKKQVKAAWAKAAAAQKLTGYEIRYKDKKSKKWKTKTAKAKATSLTVKKLAKGKAYQFQIRAYKTVSGEKYYAPWSATKTSEKVK